MLCNQPTKPKTNAWQWAYFGLCFVNKITFSLPQHFINSYQWLPMYKRRPKSFPNPFEKNVICLMLRVFNFCHLTIGIRKYPFKFPIILIGFFRFGAEFGWHLFYWTTPESKCSEQTAAEKSCQFSLKYLIIFSVLHLYSKRFNF